MPALRPSRPAPGAALVLPRIKDEEVQRALDRISLVVNQLLQSVSTLRENVSGVMSGLFDTVLTPPTITATVANWNPGELGSITLVRASADAARTVRGLMGGDNGKVVALLNVGATGANTPQYQHEDVLASVGNRFHNAGLAAQSGGSSGCVVYYYDGSAGVGVWRHIGGTQ